MSPEVVTSSVTGWMALEIPFALVGNHDQAGRFVAKLLHITARREWRKLRALAASA